MQPVNTFFNLHQNVTVDLSAILILGPTALGLVCCVITHKSEFDADASSLACLVVLFRLLVKRSISLHSSSRSGNRSRLAKWIVDDLARENTCLHRRLLRDVYIP